MLTKRDIKPNEVVMDYPEDLGYFCPNNKSHRITWSEYEAHIWCYDCEKDIHSSLCRKPSNWFCLCGAESHDYFVTCPVCGRENHLDGKGNLIK